MTDPSYTHYIMVIDRSGSMFSTANDATGGIRTFAREQAELPGRATLSFYQFDHSIEKVYDFDSIRQAENYTLNPGGSTRLLDAVGTAVTEEGSRLADMPEDQRPGKVMVLIVTDGEENSSVEWELGSLKELVTRQHDVYGWEFSFIGANIDAFSVASSIGIAGASAANYTSTSAGTRQAYAKMSNAASAYRDGTRSSLSYTGDGTDDGNS